MPDPSCNPYLALAVTLCAGLEGIKHDLDPGPPINKNIHKMSFRERRHLRIDELPGNLSDALDALEKDEVVQNALGRHIYEHFLEAKRNEWQEYIERVSGWEISPLPRRSTSRYAGCGWAASAGATSPPITSTSPQQRFFNPWGQVDRGIPDLLRWWMTAKREPWPRAVTNRPYLAPPGAVPEGQAAITMIGHCGVLVRVDGFTLLTDPHFSTHAGPFGRLGTPRVRPPGIEPRDLPAVHAVFISHNHYDHLDVAVAALADGAARAGVRDRLGLKAPLERKGIGPVIELDWWESTDVIGADDHRDAGAALVEPDDARSAPDALGRLHAERALRAADLLRRRHRLRAVLLDGSASASARRTSRCCRSAPTSRAGSCSRST